MRKHRGHRHAALVGAFVFAASAVAAVAATPASAGTAAPLVACPGGDFCVYSGTNETGTRHTFSGSNFKAINVTFKSFVNERANRAFLHANSMGDPEVCIDAETAFGNVATQIGSQYETAKFVFLAATNDQPCIPGHT